MLFCWCDAKGIKASELCYVPKLIGCFVHDWGILWNMLFGHIKCKYIGVWLVFCFPKDTCRNKSQLLCWLNYIILIFNLLYRPTHKKTRFSLVQRLFIYFHTSRIVLKLKCARTLSLQILHSYLCFPVNLGVIYM